MNMEKDKLYKKWWFWVIAGIVVIIISSQIYSVITEKNARQKAERLVNQAEYLLEGKIKVPEAYSKTKEQVEAEFENIEIEVKFVPSADLSLQEGQCEKLSDGCGAEYFTENQVGDKEGFYTDAGSTIIVACVGYDNAKEESDR